MGNPGIPRESRDKIPRTVYPFSQSTWKGSQKYRSVEGESEIYIKTSALLLVDVDVFFFFEGLLRIKELHHFRMTGSSDDLTSIFIMMYTSEHTAKDPAVKTALDGRTLTAQEISQRGVVVWNEEKFWARTSVRDEYIRRPPAPDFANFFRIICKWDSL